MLHGMITQSAPQRSNERRAEAISGTGSGAAGQNRCRAVWNASVGIDIDADVLVVAGCICQKRDLAEQIRRCKRSHAA